MEKIFLNIEDIIADECFQSWYFKIDEAQRREWEQWMLANPHQAALVAEAREYMDNMMIAERQVSENQMVTAQQRLMTTIAGQEAASVIPMDPTHRITGQQRSRSRWWWAAAAIFLLATSSVVFWYQQHPSTIHTAYGEVREQQLPDGSKVMLNANSEIRYNTGWEAGKEREVWLKGEAFFHVSKTPSKSRFVVHTDQFDVIVTGTQFNVVNRAEKTNVMLTEGSVILHTHTGDQINMKPGDFVEFNNRQLQKKAGREENVLAWRDKKLFFENTPLYTALEKIDELYGVKIKLGNEAIGNKTISGIVPNDNLDVLLEALEATNEFHVVRKDGEIIITN